MQVQPKQHRHILERITKIISPNGQRYSSGQLGSFQIGWKMSLARSTLVGYPLYPHVIWLNSCISWWNTDHFMPCLSDILHLLKIQHIPYVPTIFPLYSHQFNIARLYFHSIPTNYIPTSYSHFIPTHYIHDIFPLDSHYIPQDNHYSIEITHLLI